MRQYVILWLCQLCAKIIIYGTRSQSIPPQDYDQRLHDYRRRRVGFDWPEVVHAKLGDLVTQAEDAGARTGLAEMSAALVAFTELDSQALHDLVVKYRTMSIGEYTDAQEQASQES
jgi:hypothetical protein